MRSSSLTSSRQLVAALLRRASIVVLAATALTGAAAMVGPVTAQASVAHQATAKASKPAKATTPGAAAGASYSFPASAVPVDLDGTYTWTGCYPGPSLVVTNFIGWTSGNVQGLFDDSMGSGTVAGFEDYSIGVDGNRGLYLGIGSWYFTISASASKVTLTYNGNSNCKYVNNHPQSLASLPTISGTETRTNGTPIGPGVLSSATGGESAETYDGHYEFWVQPAQYYTVTPGAFPVNGPPDNYILTQCSGRKIPLPNSCTVELLPNNPPDEATASWEEPVGINGTVSDTDGSPIAGIEVNLTGTDSTTGKPVTKQTVSAANGSYGFVLDPGTYSVTAGPDPAGGRFLVTTCSGTSDEGACNISLKSGQSDTAEFRRAALVVNSTETGTDQAEADKGLCDITPGGKTQTCTLAQAILASNDLGGQPIAFDLPEKAGTTVPQIEDPLGTATPAITAPATIDATSQPGSGKVELSGALNTSTDSPTAGLVVASGGAGSTIKGMVINGFQDMIVLDGGHNTLQDNLLGTNPTGTAADPEPLGPPASGTVVISQIGIDILSSASGNQIGGVGQGNTVAASYSPSDDIGSCCTVGGGDIYDLAGGNTIQGNAIGLSAGGKPLIEALPSNLAPPEQFPVQLGLVDKGGGDTVGGAASDQGNVVAGGGNVDATSVVQGNSFTDGGLGTLSRNGGVGGLVVNGAATVGGATATPGQAPGNTFEAVSPTEDELELTGSGGVVQGNVFHGDSSGAVEDSATLVTIGGASAALGNLFERNGDDASPLFTAGVHVTDGPGLIEHNTFQGDAGGGAVGITKGNRVTVTENVMKSNSFGISFDGKYLGNGEGPPAGGVSVNDFLPYPVLRSAEAEASGITITGFYNVASPASIGYVHVDLYAMASCQDGAPQGEQYVGTEELSGPLVDTDIDLSFPPLPAGSGDKAVTATATAPDGSTSEFSPCFTFGSQLDPWTKLGVTPLSKTVAVSVPKTGATSASGAAVTDTSTSSGHGDLNLSCPASAVAYCKGTFTLRKTGSKPLAIASGSFTIDPGYVGPGPITITGTALASLEHAGHLSTELTTIAKDGGTKPQQKTVKTAVTLTS